LKFETFKLVKSDLVEPGNSEIIK